MSKAGKYYEVLGRGYKAFRPTLISEVEINLDRELLNLVGLAECYLGKLDGLSEAIPDLDTFIMYYVKKEAIFSSQIEGTRITLGEESKPSFDEEHNQNLDETNAYVNTLNFAVKRMNDLPISSRLIGEIHEVLLSRVLGYDKDPGQYRRSQNWIGHPGCTLKTARYIPPTVEDMKELLIIN